VTVSYSAAGSSEEFYSFFPYKYWVIYNYNYNYNYFS